MLRKTRDILRGHPAVYRLLRSFWTPPRNIYQHLYFDDVIEVAVETGKSFRLECHGEFVENELFWRGLGTGWEGKSLRTWMKLSKDARYVVDIGANTGVYSLLTKAIRPDSKVLALEPSTRVFQKLIRNIELNGFDIVAVDRAASDCNGTAIFYDCPADHQYIASLESTSGGSVSTEVQIQRMDDLLAEYGFEQVDLVKIDVELHEPAVLRGMRQSLERWRPTLLVEILNDQVANGVKQAIEGLDYVMRPIGADGSPDPKADGRNFLIARGEIFHRIGLG